MAKPQELEPGLREALNVSVDRAASTLGREDGFWGDPNARIPLPDAIKKASGTLIKLGQKHLVDDFHRSLNRAAEQAIPKVVPIFIRAIRELTIRDAWALLRGPDDALTEYLRKHCRQEVEAAVYPIVAEVTNANGATKLYKMVQKLSSPLLGAQVLDLDAFVTQHATSALFRYMAVEEKKLRQEPIARSTQLLKKLFL